MMNFEDVKIGDFVYVDCDSSFGASSCGWERVTDMRVRFDEETGMPYRQIKTDSWWDGRNGAPLAPPFSYYLSAKKN